MINKFNILNGAKYFSSGLFQNYLVFITAKKYIEYFSCTAQIDSWKPNGKSEENVENMTKSDSNFAPNFVDDWVPSLPLLALGSVYVDQGSMIRFVRS